MTSPEKLATPEINHASAETAKVLEHAIGALADILGGWRYIRQSHGDLYGVGWDRCEKSASIAIAALRTEVSRLATGRAESPDGWVLAPAWRGYALLGTRNYLLNHSAAPPDPELGAEFFITFASEADKAGNRQVGESRDTDVSGPIEAKDMVLRIGFTCHEAVDALTDQLALMRKENFPDAPPAAPSAAQGEVN